MQEAGERYQKTYEGRIKHAERQRRYRNKIVTHHGSEEPTINDLLPFVVNEGLKIVRDDKLRCHFCGGICHRLLRTSPLGREKMITLGVWPLGP